MNTLGLLLWVVVFFAWMSPRSFGRWLAKVHEGYRAAKEPTP